MRKPRSHLAPALALGGALLLAGCSGGSSFSDTSATPGGSNGGGTSASVSGPLDPLQNTLSDVLGDQIADALPAPLNVTVECADQAVTALTDVPDAILLAVAGLPNGADPAAAFQGTSEQVIASLQSFAAKLQSSLLILAGRGSACSGTLDGNPLAGTPLAPAGTVLEELIQTLASFNAPGSTQDPDLTAVTDAVAPLLDQLSQSLALLPAEVRNAPVIGGVLQTVESLTGDLANVLPDIGEYDAPGTTAGIEALLNNTLSNMLLHVLPVAQIEDQVGQNFSSQIQDGIDTLTAALGSGLGQLITPAFDQALDGALEPVLDPVEGLVAQVLGAVATGPANPLNGILGGLAGNGGVPLDSLLALLTTGTGGADFTDLLSGLHLSTSGTPLDGLASLSNPANANALDGVLGQLRGSGLPIGMIGGLLGNLPVLSGPLGGVTG